MARWTLTLQAFTTTKSEKVKRKTQQREKTENSSTVGYLLRENHTLKPHDSSIIKMTLNQMEQVENFVQGIEDKVKSD